MHNEKMDWDDVRFFLAVAREGSVNQAGKVLGVNHSTVARRTTAFEKRLGTRLFERNRTGYALTQAGEGVLGLALAMEESAQAIDRELFGWDGALKGPLKLAAPFDFFTHLVAPRLPSFLKRYPDIDLDVLTASLDVNLDAREADLALRVDLKPPEHLIGRRVMPFANAVYATPKYIERLRKKRERPAVVFFRFTQHVPVFVRTFFPDFRVALRVDTSYAMQAAVQAHLGVAYMPCYLGDSDPKLRRLKLNLTELEHGIWILNHPDLRTTARVRACREFIIDALEAQRPLIMGEHSRFSDWRPRPKKVGNV